MRVSFPAVALALPALTVSWSAVAAPDAAGAATATPQKAVVEQTTAAQSLTVVRDRATGKLRAPTPEELQALMATGRQPAVKREPREIRSHTGAPGVALFDSTLHDEAVSQNGAGRKAETQ